MLFLRRFGLTGYGALVEHWTGTEGKKRGSSWQVGASVLVLLYLERRSPYLELGVTRNTFSNEVQNSLGTATRSAVAWDGRLGFVSGGEKFAYTPWLAVDTGRFTDIQETSGDEDYGVDLGGNRAWHYIVNLGVTFAYHKTVPALKGPPPSTRPDDADRDLILDSQDKCPLAREDYYPPDAADGCPSVDWDVDGFPNSSDRCRTFAEDGLLPLPKDGCPTTDRDQDGIVDDLDACTTQLEDGLGSKPTDGCPVFEEEAPDKDGDGLPNTIDACPDEPETVNGYRDEDGCPDQRPRVLVEERAITISDRIYFECIPGQSAPCDSGTTRTCGLTATGERASSDLCRPPRALMVSAHRVPLILQTQ